MKKKLVQLTKTFIAIILLTSCNNQDTDKLVLSQEKKYVVKEALAKEIALKMLREEGKNAVAEKELEVTSVKDVNHDPYFHIVNEKKGKSFVIVSGDKRLEPVLAFGDEKFDFENASEQLKFWMKGYANKIDFIRKDKEVVASKEITSFNQKVANIGAFTSSKLVSKKQRKETEFVRQLTLTRWGQRCVYNSYAPTKEEIGCDTNASLPCGRAYTGCVATCLAQVVNYYKSMDAYDYTALNYEYTDADLGTRNGNEVGKLIKEVADIMDMKYTCNGSVSYSSDMLRKDVRERLGFDEQLKSKRLNTMEIDEIYNELKEGNPMVISGKDYNNGRRVGHLWVVDGFLRYYAAKEENDQVYLHFNLGWSGSSNGWYLYNDFNLGSYNLNHYVTMYYNFRKNN
ncbi:putative Inhibitor_I69 domain-containing protein [Tenacibaculum sp. 190524A02b]|uniref:Inhibitor_I69 domain-containing protein n=1 Tax=Tenacibaculum vairaonense TaxID=3137860 RepID=A0ABM9PI40_9FLAO